MKLNSSHLETFYVVSQVKNFSRASEIMFISQPAITQRIKQLESQLDCQLFIRGSGGIDLTEEGKKLIIYYINQKQSEEALVRSIKDQGFDIHGRFSVLCGSALLSESNLKAVTELSEKFPHLDISIKLDDDQISEPTKLLRGGQFDAIVTQNQIDNKYVQSLKITDVSLVLVITADLDISVNPDKEDLFKYRIIDTSPFDLITLNHLRVCYKDSQDLTFKRYYINNTQGILEWVVMGKGFSALPYYMVQDYVQKKRLKILFPEVNSSHPLFLATLKSNDTLVSKVFYEMIKEKWQQIESDSL